MLKKNNQDVGGTPNRNMTIINEPNYITNNYNNHVEGLGKKRSNLK